MGLLKMNNDKRYFLLFVFFTLFFGSLVVGSANAAILYVSPTGNDTNPGTISAPVASLNRANNLASPGDTIYLRGGTYTATRYVYCDKAGLTISSYPGERAVIVGSSTDTTNLGYIIFLLADNQTLMNLEIQGGSYYCVKVETNRNCVIRNCRLGGSGRDCVKTFNSDNLLIESCNIGPSGVRDASNAECIDSIASVGVTIRDCYLHDSTTTGVYLKGSAINGVIERNRVERCGNAGILLGQDTDLEFMRDGNQYECRDSVVRNNIVINTQYAGIGTYSGSNVRFENNTVIDVAKQGQAGLYVATNGREIPARQVTFKNNVVVVNSTRPLAYILNLSDQLVSNSNIFYKPAASGAYKFWFESPTRTYYWDTFNEWTAGLNVDARSLTTDPMLDLANLCQPLSGSPTIDRGETVSNPNDYQAAARPQGASFDIGAHERAGSGNPPPPPTNQPPTISITATPTSGNAPLNVAFIANANDPEGQTLTYSWNFGDGQTSTQANPSHLYQSAGSFTAVCTVSDPLEATATARVTITVGAPANLPPTVTATANITRGPAPLFVSFRGSAADSDGYIVAYNWDFGDGQTSTDASPSHTYQQLGIYTARLTVRDNAGATAGTQVVITVDNSESPPFEVYILTPNGGEVIAGGSVHTIRWELRGIGADTAYRIDVAYSLDGGRAWIDIINGPAGYNTLNWTVPNVKCKTAKIRVVVFRPGGTEQNQSQQNFTIYKVKGRNVRR